MAEDNALAMLRPADDISALMPNEITEADIKREVTIYNRELRAPLAAGTVMGEIRISVGSTVYGTSKLVNSSAIELSRNAYLTQRVAEILSKGWVITLLVILTVFALIYIVLVTRYRRLRKKHLKERRRAEKRRREEELERRRRGIQVNTVDRIDFEADMSEFFDDEEKET